MKLWQRRGEVESIPPKNCKDGRLEKEMILGTGHGHEEQEEEKEGEEDP